MQSKEIKEVIVSDRGSITGNIMQTILVGLSAYEVAVKNGFVGTEQEWLDSLMGESVEVSVIKDTREEYVLSFTVGEDTIITPNLKGNVELTPEQLEVIIQNVEAIILEDIDNRYVQKEDGKSLVDDTEIERLKDVHNYDDTEINQKINEINLNDLEINKIADYLYSCKYQNYDYDYAYKYFSELKESDSFGCSSVRIGNLFGRNLDVTYDNTAEFIVKTPSYKGFYSVIGIAEITDKLYENIVDSGEYSDLYKILPFWLMDGINEKGLTMNVNLVPIESNLERTIGTNPSANISVNTLMLTRYILDRCATVEEAIDEIRRINIYSNPSNEYHFMIADESETVVIEFYNNSVQICRNEEVMTNFYLRRFDGNTSTATYKSETFNPNTTRLTLHANGVERYDILKNGKENVDTVEDMLSLMKSVHYTKMYKRSTNPFWYSEYNEDDLTIKSTAIEYDEKINSYINAYENRSRNKGTNYGTWQTIHTSVYDIYKKSLIICCQENYDKCFTFDLNEIESLKEDIKNKADKMHNHVIADITDFPSSMPASDVYDWAKQETKPTYTKSEVGLSNVDNTKDIDKPLSNAMMEALEDMDGIIEGHTENEDIHVTAEEKSSWDNKSDFSGSYNDLSDLPQAETEDIDFSEYFK